MGVNGLTYKGTGIRKIKGKGIAKGNKKEGGDCNE